MMEKKRIPEIRFDGFEEEWEEKRLGDEVDFYSGLTYSLNDVIDNEDGTFVIRSSNIKESNIINADDVYVKNEVVNSKNVTIDDVIVVVRNGSRDLIGKHAIVRKDLGNTVIGAFMTGIKSNDGKFTNALLDSNQFYKEINKTLGATINQITLGNFNKMKFYVPTFSDEIKKIGQLFYKLDLYIYTLERKIEYLKSYKQLMLQKMFPKQGEKFPEIRFEGFEGEWEEKRLEECFDERNERSSEGELISVTINDGIKKFSELNRTDNSSENKSNYKVVKIGDIAYNSLRMWQGASGYSNYNGILSPAYIVLIPLEDTDSKFFSYYFKKNYVIYKFGSFSEGITKDQWTLKYNSFKRIRIFVPSLPEQQQIGAFFQSLDNQISLQQQKLDTYKNLKKTLLDKMFI